MSTLTDEILRRRTFAIISHPDAGKTTLTEKLLLFGGAIQLAGEVKARGERRRVRSDWMAVERERGISVSSAVMSFEHEGLAFNLLDTPGHQDFSPLLFIGDTYRTLTAVDSAVMVLDAAKGIEEQTRMLFEVCGLQDVPIIKSKNARRGRPEKGERLSEVEQNFARLTPAVARTFRRTHRRQECKSSARTNFDRPKNLQRPTLHKGHPDLGLADPGFPCR